MTARTGDLNKLRAYDKQGWPPSPEMWSYAINLALAAAGNGNHGGPAEAPQVSTWAPVDLGPATRGEQAGTPPGVLHRTDGVGMFYPGKVHVVAGEPESGKTWLVLVAVARVLAAGGKVCFVDFEDDATGVVGRLRALGVQAATIVARFIYLRPDQALDETGGHHLDDGCTDAELAVIDGTTEGMAVHGWAPKNDVDVALWQGRILRRMAGHGCAVAAIDHVVKDKEGRGRWATGSQHKLAGIDGVQYLIDCRKPWAPGRSGLARITVVKDRPGLVRAGLEDLRTFGDMVVTCWPDGGVSIDLEASQVAVAAADGGMRPTTLMDRCSVFLAAHSGQDDISTKAVRAGVRGDNSAIDRALDVLQLEGYATSSRHGQGTYWSHVKPFSGGPGGTEDA